METSQNLQPQKAKLITLLLLATGVFFLLFFVTKNYFFPPGETVKPSTVVQHSNPTHTPAENPANLGPKVEVKSNPIVDTLIIKSLNAYNAKDYNGAINNCLEALKIDSKNIIVLNNLCAAYNALGQYKEGAAACQRALEIDPEYQLAKNNLQWAQQALKGQ